MLRPGQEMGGFPGTQLCVCKTGFSLRLRTPGTITQGTGAQSQTAEESRKWQENATEAENHSTWLRGLSTRMPASLFPLPGSGWAPLEICQQEC